MTEFRKPFLDRNVGLFAIKITLGLAAVYFLARLHFDKELVKAAKISRGNECEKCGSNTDGLTPHHILPVSLGGADIKENMYLVCRSCHQDVDRLALRDGYLAPIVCNLEDVGLHFSLLIGNLQKYNSARSRFTSLRAKGKI